jgi:predicted N-acetyltransferase YhbS
MLTIRHEKPIDRLAREALLDAAFGADRFERTCQRLRDDRLPAESLSFAAIESGHLIGTVRLWHIDIGNGRRALLLGPLAVSSEQRSRGIGGKLMARAIREAAKLGYEAILLRGDAAYYGQFGFSADKTGALALPGAFEVERLLGLELRQGAFDGARGMIAPSGRRIGERASRRPNTLPLSHAA